MHKLDQGELQLDRSQPSYPEYLGLNTAGGSLAQNHKRPNTEVSSPTGQLCPESPNCIEF